MPASAPGRPRSTSCRTQLAGRRRFLLDAAALLAVIAANGCTGGGSPLSVAAHVWPGYELMFLARREGWLDERLARLVDTASATESMLAIEAGSVDAAALTLDETLRVLDRGVPVKVALVFNVSSGADVVLARGGLRTLADLAGKRIGVEDSAVGALMLQQLLARAGLSETQVRVIPLTIDRHAQAWRSQAVDALVTYEPVAGELRRLDAHVIFDSTAIPDTIFDVLAVRADRLEHHRGKDEGLRALITAHFRALAHLHRNPVDAGHRLAARLGGSGAHALDSYRGLLLPDVSANQRLLRPGTSNLHLAAAELSRLLHSQHRIASAPALEGLFDPSYLSEALRSERA